MSMIWLLFLLGTATQLVALGTATQLVADLSQASWRSSKGAGMLPSPGLIELLVSTVPARQPCPPVRLSLAASPGCFGVFKWIVQQITH